jgi:hypothetical protein
MIFIAVRGYHTPLLSPLGEKIVMGAITIPDSLKQIQWQRNPTAPLTV